MKEFLQKVKLLDYLTTEIEMDKSQFVSNFKEHVDQSNVSNLTDAFDIFSSSKNEYKGKVDLEGFKIKRKRKIFDSNINMAIATGTYTQNNEKLIIETEINGFNKLMIPFFVIVILFYIIFLSAFLFADDTGNHQRLIFLPFIFFHAAFMIGIPYFLMRRSTKRLKYELEREFYFMTKK